MGDIFPGVNFQGRQFSFRGNFLLGAFFRTLFRGYPWNIFETDICGMFLKYSGNITSWLLDFAKRSPFVINKPYTFNIKTTFPSRNFKKIFSFKIFQEDVVEKYHWDVLAAFHRDVVRCFIWEIAVTFLRRTERRHYDFATTCCCRVWSLGINHTKWIWLS